MNRLRQRNVSNVDPENIGRGKRVFGQSSNQNRGAEKKENGTDANRRRPLSNKTNATEETKTRGKLPLKRGSKKADKEFMVFDDNPVVTSSSQTSVLGEKTSSALSTCSSQSSSGGPVKKVLKSVHFYSSAQKKWMEAAKCSEMDSGISGMSSQSQSNTQDRYGFRVSEKFEDKENDPCDFVVPKIVHPQYLCGTKPDSVVKSGEDFTKSLEQDWEDSLSIHDSDSPSFDKKNRSQATSQDYSQMTNTSEITDKQRQPLLPAASKSNFNNVHSSTMGEEHGWKENFQIYKDNPQSESRDMGTSMSLDESCFDDYFTVSSSRLCCDEEKAWKIAQDTVYCSPEYDSDIFQYLKAREAMIRPIQYMRKQSEICKEHRFVVVDWLVDVAEEYGMQEETLHLAVRYLDLFLSAMDVPKRKLQLVGTTAMMIASKLEEVYPPESKEFVAVTDDSYTMQQLLNMELLMLDALDMQLCLPTSLCFARKFLKMINPDETNKRLIHAVMYVLELALTRMEFLDIAPSKIAAAGVCFGNLICDEPISWPSELADYSGYTTLDIMNVLNLMIEAVQKAPNREQRAVYDKYTQQQHYEVATMFKAPFKIEIVDDTGMIAKSSCYDLDLDCFF